MSTLVQFIQQLGEYPASQTVENFYRNSALSKNLHCYLHELLRIPGCRILLVGEAPGYKGCRLTGIPFTSGTIFDRFDHWLLKRLRPLLTIDEIDSENTATIVWDYLSHKEATPLFWNAFFLHPHLAGNVYSNRAPSAAEMKVGIECLRWLGELYQPDIVAGIGKKGTLAAQKAFPAHEVHSIRHPSHGGKRDFIAGMDRIL